MAENTFFGEIHKELDAKMSPSGKWNMPLFYPGGSVAEHRHTRAEASIFDMSGARIFQLTGQNAAEVLDEILLYDTGDIAVGGSMKNILLHENGTFAARFTLCRMQENDFMLLTEAGLPEKEIVYLTGTLSRKLEVRELSEAMAHLAVIGQKSVELLSGAGAENLPENGHWAMITVKDDEDDEFRCIAIGRDRFGERGFELCCNAAVALEVYGALYRINGMAPAGMQAWESLRIESGEPGIPAELNENVFPQECGMIPELSGKFTGRESLLKKNDFRKLVAIELERHPATPGTAVMCSDSQIGIVTSGAFCPSAACARNLCLIDAGCAVESGDTVSCSVNGKNVSAVVL